MTLAFAESQENWSDRKYEKLTGS